MVTIWLTFALAAASGDFTAPGRAAFEKASGLFKRGEYEKALPLFELANRLSNGRPSATFGLAQCERALGDLESAVLHFEEILRVAPADQAADRARVALEEIRHEHPEFEKTVIHPPQDASPPKPDPVGPIAPPPPPPTVSPPIDPDVSPDLTGTSGSSDEPPDEGTFWTHPATWIVAGAVAIAGGVTAGWLLTRDNDPNGGSSGVVLNP